MTDQSRAVEPPKNGKLIEMPRKTYSAKSFEVGVGNNILSVSGTLDGFIDLATPTGTYPLSLEEAKNLAAALNDSASDVKANCLYDADVLLIKEKL